MSGPAARTRSRDPKRRPALEERLIQAVADRVDHPQRGSFTAGVLARLDQRGYAIQQRPLAAYFRELAEEALDLGGWSLLAAQHEHGAAVLPTLLEVARYGCAAHAAIARAEAQR